MDYLRARQQLDAAYRRGDIDADTWRMERDALEYAHEQQQSDADERQGVVA